MTDEPTVKSILVDARERIADFDDWTQESYRKKCKGHWCYCATGAIIFAPDAEGRNAYATNQLGGEALKLLRRAAEAKFGMGIIELNDERAGRFSQEEVHQRVLEAYDLAIQDAE